MLQLQYYGAMTWAMTLIPAFVLAVALSSAVEAAAAAELDDGERTQVSVGVVVTILASTMAFLGVLALLMFRHTDAFRRYM